jgi:hypothetical protein
MQNLRQQAKQGNLRKDQITLTPESQRIAIAEACGWKFDPLRGNKTYPWWEPHHGETIHGFECSKSTSHKSPPNYLNDLNAMQSAVLSQDDDFITRFALEMNKAENRLHKHQWAMSAQDYADCFIAVLNSKRTLERRRLTSKHGGFDYRFS